TLHPSFSTYHTTPLEISTLSLHDALPISGVVQPYEHYLPLEKDFSNFDEVSNALRDIDRLEDLTERAYSDLIASGRYSYRSFIRSEEPSELQSRGHLVCRLLLEKKN